MRLILTILLLAGCSYEKHSPISNDLQSEFEKRCERVSIEGITRCDRVTFVALLSAFCPTRAEEFKRYEYPEGKWNRDVSSCYPNDSASETSRDGYLSVLQALKSSNDYSALRRIIDYAEPRGGSTGEGDEGIVNIWPLMGTIHQMAGDKPLDGASDQLAILNGFRGAQIANYLLLKGRINGYLGVLEMEFAEKLDAQVPHSPWYSAIYHKYHDGDQSFALEGLKNFPTEDAPYGWGSCPNDIYWILTYITTKGF